MNSFAKYLFQGMFSWVREALRQLSDPRLIDSWLATHWLSALIPILLNPKPSLQPSRRNITKSPTLPQYSAMTASSF